MAELTRCDTERLQEVPTRRFFEYVEECNRQDAARERAHRKALAQSRRRGRR